MKAISLYEPWATLIALGLKRYETRSWETFHRGPLLICASKKKLPFIEIANLLFLAKLTPDDLQYGKALAIIDLIDILPTENLIGIPDLEKKFGDFSPNRYAWHLQNIRRFLKPALIRGKQGLFYAPDFYQQFKTYDSI